MQHPSPDPVSASPTLQSIQDQVSSYAGGCAGASATVRFFGEDFLGLDLFGFLPAPCACHDLREIRDDLGLIGPRHHLGEIGHEFSLRRTGGFAVGFFLRPSFLLCHAIVERFLLLSDNLGELGVKDSPNLSIPVLNSGATFVFICGQLAPTRKPAAKARRR